jgi:hypothetical protein
LPKALRSGSSTGLVLDQAMAEVQHPADLVARWAARRSSAACRGSASMKRRVSPSGCVEPSPAS